MMYAALWGCSAPAGSGISMSPVTCVKTLLEKVFSVSVDSLSGLEKN